MATWEDVRALAAGLDGVEEGTSYRQPALKVGGRAFVLMSPHADGALVLPCEPEERPLMLASRPDVFYVTPHYEGAPYVLARLESIDREELAGRLEDAYELVKLRARRSRRPRAGGDARRSATRRRRPS